MQARGVSAERTRGVLSGYVGRLGRGDGVEARALGCSYADR